MAIGPSRGMTCFRPGSVARSYLSTHVTDIDVNRDGERDLVPGHLDDAYYPRLGNNLNGMQVGLDGPCHVVLGSPTGRPDEHLGLAVNAYHTLQQSDQVAVLDSTVAFGFDFDPDTGTMDWRFEWQTTNWTDPACDVVEIERVRGSSCGFDNMVLSVDAESGVSHHTLTWRAQSCFLGCTYRFHVASKVDETKQAVTSESHDFSFFACPSGD